MILRQSIRLEHVGSNLAPPCDLELAIFDRLGLGSLLFHLQFEKPRAENFHADGFVLVLGALVLALNNDAGGQMSDTDGRVGRVHVLAAFSGRPVRVDPQFLFFNDDFDGLIDFGIDRHGGE